MRLRVTVCALVVCVCAGAAAVDPPGPARLLTDIELDPDTLRVHFIDIGPGLAVLVQTPGDRKTLFIDGGDQGGKHMMKYLAHFLPGDTLDSLFVTHADQDHFFNSRKLFEQYEVGEFVYTGYTSPELKALKRWKAFLAQAQSEPGIDFYVPAGEHLPLGFVELYENGGTATSADDVTITYLNVDKVPPEQDPHSNRAFSESERRNNASLVFRLHYGQTSFLFTGDINGRDKEHTAPETDDEIDSEEFNLVDNAEGDTALSVRSTVLQLPHHGSNGSCSLPFLEAVSPEWVVIPAGHKHNHPTEGALRRLGKAGVPAAHILRTDDGDPIDEDSATHSEPTGDDNFVFVVNEDGIQEIIRVSVP